MTQQSYLGGSWKGRWYRHANQKITLSTPPQQRVAVHFPNKHRLACVCRCATSVFLLSFVWWIKLHACLLAFVTISSAVVCLSIPHKATFAFIFISRFFHILHGLSSKNYPISIFRSRILHRFHLCIKLWSLLFLFNSVDLMSLLFFIFLNNNRLF